jgi:membrane-associated protein
MGYLSDIFGFIFHFDRHLDLIVSHFGAWTYLFLFLILFAETGLVVTPFLPGDSLLFVVGAFSARGAFHPAGIFFILAFAAILGDSVNYAIGKYFGEALSRAERIPFFRKEHLARTHAFYEKYGAKTIVLARFVPIIRTFAPFVAGLGEMGYAKFFTYNVLGGILWVGIFVFGGYYFGNIPAVKEHFSLVILAIIVLSVLPALYEVAKARLARPRKG